MPAVPSLIEQGSKRANRFDDFFADPVYLEFKNHLYNYLLRKGEVKKQLEAIPRGTLVEIGSGVSPIAEPSPGVIYTDMSENAMRMLARSTGRSVCVADASKMPFADRSVSTIVCSEVIEHIPDDGAVLREMSRVLKSGSYLVLTVPAHAYFYAYDDRFVKHFRRYNIDELRRRLEELGFEDFHVSKVTGLIEKAVMITVVWTFAVFGKFFEREGKSSGAARAVLPLYKAINRIFSHVVKAEAKIMPLSCSSIVLIRCRKRAA